MQIDFSQLVNAESQAASAAHDHAQALRQACRTQIEDVLDLYTQSNIQLAMLAGALSDDDVAAMHAARDWVTDMRAACQSAIAAGTEAHWPQPSEAVQALAKKF